MSRISPLEHDLSTGPVRSAFDDGLKRWGRLTNMKRTLLHSLPSYKVLMEWYTLYETIEPFAGERNAIAFAHALSTESDCLICTTFMRRILIDSGDDPDNLALDERGEALVRFGRAIARQGNRVSDSIYAEVERLFSKEEIVALTAFAAMMIATNVINNVLEVELDEYLYEYRAESARIDAEE